MTIKEGLKKYGVLIFILSALYLGAIFDITNIYSKLTNNPLIGTWYSDVNKSKTLTFTRSSLNENNKRFNITYIKDQNITGSYKKIIPSLNEKDSYSLMIVKKDNNETIVMLLSPNKESFAIKSDGYIKSGSNTDKLQQK